MKDETLFKICRILALNDSVAEGYSYNSKYDRQDYEQDKNNETHYGYYEIAKEIYNLVRLSKQEKGEQQK